MSIQPPPPTIAPIIDLFPFRTVPPVDTTAQNLGNRLVNAVATIIATVATAALPDAPVLRQEVPFERWFFNHGRSEFKETKDEMAARGYALLHTLEGAVRIAVEGLRLLFARFISRDEAAAARYQTILTAQLQSITLTAWAIVDPNGVKKRVAAGQYLIGCPLSDMKWGTPYYGTLTIPVSLNYNWKSPA